jgi:hypothetical protein
MDCVIAPCWHMAIFIYFYCDRDGDSTTYNTCKYLLNHVVPGASNLWIEEKVDSRWSTRWGSVLVVGGGVLPNKE